MQSEGLLDTVNLGWRNIITRQWFFLNIIASCTVINNNTSEKMENRPEVEYLHNTGDWVGQYGILANASFASAKAVVLRILNNRREIEIHVA
jgi:hypothetical protein